MRRFILVVAFYLAFAQPLLAGNDTGTSSSLLYPDLHVIVPADKISIEGAGSTRQLQYTHDTFNAGPGPLVIQPALNSASGNYQGSQYIYSYSSEDGWSLNDKIPVAGAFVFHSEHGHFHFPLVTFGLYDTSGANGGPGKPIVLSDKNGFCITDSFILDPSLPHAGETGNFGSCSDPTSLRGIHIGAVDEYDKTDPGQSIVIGDLPDGNYWLKVLADPNNYLAESDKTNNETDVLLKISGNNVQALRTVIPVLEAPPVITLTSPAPGIFVSGNVTLKASPATVSDVQYLLDGLPYGPIVSDGPSYNLSWDTTKVPDGSHSLAAQTTDPVTGITSTSEVTQVVVNNGTGNGPVVQLTDPANDSILSETVTLYAKVAGKEPIAGVEFFVDDISVGKAISPPYMISWDTTTVSDGPHKIKAVATDSLGNVSSSTLVIPTVDNSHPAKLIGTDVLISVDGQGAMTTPSFSTATENDLLVAFLTYDGPSNSAQSAGISGAGLTWTLLVRSNTQSGTSEIWSARANGMLNNVTVASQQGTHHSFHGSLTVIAFTDAAGTSVVGRAGAPSGAPNIYLPGVIAGDWVFAVGNGSDAVARTPVSGQALVHQRVDKAVDETFWVQSTKEPSAANGLVDIRNTQPTSSQWNYAAVEIVAARQ